MLSRSYSRIHDLFNGVCYSGLRSSSEKSSSSSMRFLVLLTAAASLAAPALPADARGLQRLREQDAAYQAAQQGRSLTLPEIRARIRIPGAHFIGAEMIGPNVYRLKFMRGPQVIWIDVEARTGRVVARQ